jgi:RNA polymerase sigma-70 factor (ECF subfamily)
MRALQASLPNFRPHPARRQSRERVGKGKSAPSNSAISITGSETTVVSPAFRNEWVLVQEALRGDSHVQEQMFVPHIRRLQRTALGILRNKEDAEDAVQDALCRAYIRLQSFQGKSSFATWLTRIVINSALMIRRRRNGRQAFSLEEIVEGNSERPQLQIVDAGPNPEQICRITEVHGLLEEEMRQLPPRLREAIRLCDLEGHSTAASSQILGIRNSAFKSRILRARQKLAKRLRDSLLTSASLSPESIPEIAQSEMVLSWQTGAIDSPVFGDASCQ